MPISRLRFQDCEIIKSVIEATQTVAYNNPGKLIQWGKACLGVRPWRDIDKPLFSLALSFLIWKMGTVGFKFGFSFSSGIKSYTEAQIKKVTRA